MRLESFAPFANFRKQIGSGIFLLWVLCHFAGPEQGPAKPFVSSNGGKAMSDPQLAVLLDVSPATIARWRLALRAAGLIDWRYASDGRVFSVAAHFISPFAGVPNAPASSDEGLTGRYIQ